MGQTKVGGRFLPGWIAITPTVASGTATVALGNSPLNTFAYTTGGNTIVNFSGSTDQFVSGLVTLGGTHTLEFRYNGSTSNVAPVGKQSTGYDTTSGNKYFVQGQVLGGVLYLNVAPV